MAPSTAVLLINLGTPEAPEPGAVARYLREFLMDPRVIDLPWAVRWPLVNLVIAPFRAPRSAAAYRTVWTAGGSPLLVHSRALAEALRVRLGVPVALGMRYGRPSVVEALDRLGAVDRLVVVPLYPQRADATTTSALDALEAARAGRGLGEVVVVPPFWDEPGWVDAVARTAEPHLRAFLPDHVLFSYHGLPVRQLQRVRPSCQGIDGCCDRAAAEGGCYRAQCVASSEALARALGLSAWSSAWQSRLGSDAWTRPATEDELRRLADEGVRRVSVLCPSFVTDCLETLEEIAARGRETFQKAGGEDLQLVPCLNAQPAWVEALAELVGRRLPAAPAVG